MPKEIYKTRQVYTIDGVEIDISPLKIKYLKELMKLFSLVYLASNEVDTINIITECVRIAMKQYRPELSKDIHTVEDNFDLQTLYRILNYSSGIKVGGEAETEEENITEQAQREGQESTWDDLDLPRLESEVFLLGIWKNFEELESSLCIEELMQILSTMRELNFEEKKFTAALQGVDLDGGDDDEVRGQQEWENLKARVASGGATNDANDILALQGQAAAQAGFGIGMGLSYENLVDESKLIKK